MQAIAEMSSPPYFIARETLKGLQQSAEASYYLPRHKITSNMRQSFEHLHAIGQYDDKTRSILEHVAFKSPSGLMITNSIEVIYSENGASLILKSSPSINAKIELSPRAETFTPRYIVIPAVTSLLLAYISRTTTPTNTFSPVIKSELSPKAASFISSRSASPTIAMSLIGRAVNGILDLSTSESHAAYVAMLLATASARSLSPVAEPFAPRYIQMHDYIPVCTTAYNSRSATTPADPISPVFSSPIIAMTTAKEAAIDVVDLSTSESRSASPTILLSHTPKLTLSPLVEASTPSRYFHIQPQLYLHYS
jgi:hypothetical protein